MTNRESDIYNLIEKNPFISQNSIAERLNITRSAVSGYINTMYKKGIISGRGYVLTKPPYTLLIGPSHIDIKSVCTYLKNDSVHKSLETQVIYGGPIKNVAEFLIGMEIFPKAIFSVSSDNFGISFLDSCEKTGIPAEDSVIVNGETSPVYIEMTDIERNLLAASFTPNNLTAHITSNHLKTKYDVIKNAGIIVAHDSLPRSSVEYLQTFKNTASLLMISSNIEYTSNLRGLYNIFDITVFPYYIAHMLVEGYGESDTTVDIGTDEILNLSKKICQLGFSKFYIILSASQICYFEDDKVTIHSSENPTKKRIKNSRLYLDCRDIVVATITYCIENNTPLDKTLNMIAAARNWAIKADKYLDRSISLSTIEDYEKSLIVSSETLNTK